MSTSATVGGRRVPPLPSKASKTDARGSHHPGAESAAAEILALQPAGMITPSDLPSPALPARLDQESPELYSRFAWWCSAPERGERRTWAMVAQRFGVDAKTVREQASRHEWLARAIAWDKARIEKAAHVAGQLQAEAAVSHVSLAQDLVDQCQFALRQCQDLLDGPIDLEVMETWQRMASGISKTLEKAQKVARLALGQSDSNVSMKVETKTTGTEIDWSLFSSAEIRLIRAAERLQTARAEGGAAAKLPHDVQRYLGTVEAA